MKKLLQFTLIFFLFNNVSFSQSVNIPIRVTDGVNSDTLYFGLDTTATDGIDASLNETELPPRPPASVFDARFTGETTPPISIGEGLRRDYRQGTPKTIGIRKHHMRYQRGTGSILRISWWNIPALAKVRLQDIVSGSLIDTTFTGAGSYNVPSMYLSLERLSLTVTYDPTVTMNLKIIYEGFYDPGTNRLNQRDTVRAYLRQAVSPFSIIDSSKSIIDSVNFTGTFVFKKTLSGNYYIVPIHRNGIEVWSKSGGAAIVAGTATSYDFTTSLSQTFGNNALLIGTKYCAYSGDVNKDGSINLIDIITIYTDATLFKKGYFVTDLNGDNSVKLQDILLAYNNSRKFVVVKRP